MNSVLDPVSNERVTKSRVPSTTSATPAHQAWVAGVQKEPLRLETVDLGPFQPEAVEIEVEHCGLCHSDLSVLSDDWGISRYPAVLGHEVVGRVTALTRCDRDNARLRFASQYRAPNGAFPDEPHQ